MAFAPLAVDQPVAPRRALAVLVGTLQPFGPRGGQSAIAKGPVPAAYVSAEGVAGDTHGDPVRHGGPDKAVHHYPVEHYRYWRAQGVASDVLDAPGAFGENVTTVGMTEDDVCVGDVYRVGEAGLVLQVAQNRQPCWKIGHRLGVPRIAERVQQAGRTGWHYRVLQPGTLAVGDAFALVERPHPAWPLARLVETLYRRSLDRELLAQVAELEALAPGMRELARKRLATAKVESWANRLHGSEAG